MQVPSQQAPLQKSAIPAPQHAVMEKGFVSRLMVHWRSPGQHSPVSSQYCDE